MTSPMDASCDVQGAQYLGAEPAEVCARFQDRLAAAIDGRADSTSLRISINVMKTEMIDATIETLSGDGARTYPGVSVVVMDRALNMSDIDELARTAGEVIMDEETAESPSAKQL